MNESKQLAEEFYQALFHVKQYHKDHPKAKVVGPVYRKFTKAMHLMDVVFRIYDNSEDQVVIDTLIAFNEIVLRREIERREQAKIAPPQPVLDDPDLDLILGEIIEDMASAGPTQGNETGTNS
jgi:hypothetical protein